jgi:outer membrane protein assembly factor BamB
MRSARFLATIALTLLLTGAGQSPPDAALDRHAEANWPMYGRNLRHSFSNPQSRINPGNVASLRQVWAFPTADVVSASPTVVDGVIYVGSWDGFFYALDAKSGTLIWKFQVDCQNTIIPAPPHCLAPGEVQPPRFFTEGGLITSTAAVVHGRVYFAAGKTVYSLDAKTGALRWKRVLCGNPEVANCASDPRDPTNIFSSPAVAGGLVFVGHTADGAEGYRGAIVALDADAGTPRWRFEVDPILDAQGEPVLGPDGQAVGGYNRGCGSVWSSAAVDPGAGLVFFSTADCRNDATPPYHEAILALELETGLPRWVYRPRERDRCDLDFGATPNLIDHAGRRYLGVGGKDGTYYLLKRRTADPKGELVWARNVVFGGTAGGFFGASFEDGRIYAATMLGDGYTELGFCDPSDPRDTMLQEPSIHALSVADGSVLWQRTQNHSAAPTSLANGVVFSGLIGTESEGFGVKAYDARTGDLLARLPMAGSVNSAATPLGDMLFVTAGTSVDGSGSGVFAFALP